MTKPAWFYRQSGVIPFREVADGFDILLITTHRKRHWTIPKRIVEPGMSPSASAIKEAWEEAGIRGFLLPSAIGSYQQQKWGGLCRIEVFLLQVNQQAERWPESALRERCWFPIGDTLLVLHNEDLKKLMFVAAQRLDDRYRPDGVNPIEELQI